MAQIGSFYSDAFKIALSSILEQKLRAFLTLIGIIIGVAAVVVVGASISGLKTYVIEGITKVLGSNHFMITRMASMEQLSGEEWERRNRLYKDVTWQEYEYVLENCRLCSYVGAQMSNGADLKEGIIEMPSVRVIGVTSSMYEIEDKTMTEGRFFSKEEVQNSTRVAIVGTDVVDKLYEGQSPMGKTVKIRGVPFKIIGIEQKRGSLMGQSNDRNIYIPITLHGQIFNRTGGIQIHGKTIEKEPFLASIEEARNLIRNRRQLLGGDEDTFSTVNVDDFNKTMDSVTGMIAMVVVPVTMIILVVGGIVVMNIMLVSVTERTFEVGLRKAIGATRGQILLQFLIESALLCVVGGILGLMLAVGATRVVGYLLGITMTITMVYVVASVLVSSGIGIIAGLYPAWKASTLDPIVALTKN